MKKWICCVLILAFLTASAVAESLRTGETLKEGDLNLTLRSASVTDEWNGQTSATHAWIVVELTAQTFTTEPVDLSDALSATVTFQGKYVYDAALEFETDELEPLVELPGRLVFRVPLLVARTDPSELAFAITCAGISHPVALRYAPAADGDFKSVFFDQPEDAILFFVDHVKQGDFMGALNATAAGSIAEAYQYAAYVERMKSIQPSSTMTLPSDYPSYVALNRLGALDSMRRQMVWMIQSLLIGPEMNDGSPRFFSGDQINITDSRTMTIDEYILQLDPSRLQGLTVRAIYCLDSDLYHSERNQENIRKSGAIFGYSASKDFLMIYEFDGRLYQHACTMVQFEKGWQIYGLYSILLNTNSFGGATYATEADVQALEASGDYLKVYPKD